MRLHALDDDDYWEVDPETLRELTQTERLSARVALANHASRWRR
ncbi:hypothetical protein [Streptomyces sp. NPDC057939]